MHRSTIEHLVLASRELRKDADAGKASRQREREQNRTFCRLGDSAIEQYESLANAIDELTSRFPDFHPESPQPEPHDHSLDCVIYDGQPFDPSKVW